MVRAIVVCCLALSACNDARDEALELARDDLSCATDADCCVVFDGCMARGLVVSSADRQKAADLLADAPHDTCVECIPPWVQVRCESQRCTGYELESGASTSPDYSGVAPFSGDHCGSLTVPEGWHEKAPATNSSSLRQGLVIGC